jgi:hypothetical protein
MFGSEILSCLNAVHEDKISFSFNPENTKQWFLKKSDNHVGYKIVKSSVNSRFFHFRIAWDVYNLTSKDYKLKEVSWTKYQDGILIDAGN